MSTECTPCEVSPVEESWRNEALPKSSEIPSTTANEADSTMSRERSGWLMNLPAVVHHLKSDYFKGTPVGNDVGITMTRRRMHQKVDNRRNCPMEYLGIGIKTMKLRTRSTPLPYSNSLPRLLRYGSSARSQTDLYNNTCLSKLMQKAYKVDALDMKNNIAHNLSPGSDKITRRKLKSTIDIICTELNLDETKLQNLELFPEFPIFDSLKHQLSNNLFSDTCKQLAFRNWQKEDLSKCMYYLSESHGHFLHADILDKHNSYFCLSGEYRSSSYPIINPEVEKIKIKKFRQQSKDLIAFGRNMNSFKENINKLNPDWNIVQLTSMFDVNNRFSSSIFSNVETPALFLTCSLNIPRAKNRSSFVTYIDQPVLDPGVTGLGVLGEFKQVMLKNSSINAKYVGDRKLYWEVRKEHNTHLSRVLDEMEQKWLFPWNFLLPGTIVDEDIQKKIYNFIQAVELCLTKKLSEFQKVALYKLTENCSYLQKELLGDNLRKLVGQILNHRQDRVKKITERVLKIGLSIPPDAKRHPTILILDQNIEQLPWDWMPCLRTTPVTRVQSIALVYALSNLVKPISPINPNRCTFILNPDGSLKSVQARLESYFQGRKTWEGISGKKPNRKDIEQSLQNDHIFLYCGHGSGQCIFPDYMLQRLYCRAIPILMGCGSAQYEYDGPKTYSSSVINSYFIAACPSVVGFLWEITDVECDRITVDLMEYWAPGEGEMPEMTAFDNTTPRPRIPCLATAVRISRMAATQFLTQAGLVNYGLPILSSL